VVLLGLKRKVADAGDRHASTFNMSSLRRGIFEYRLESCTSSCESPSSQLLTGRGACTSRFHIS